MLARGTEPSGTRFGVSGVDYTAELSMIAAIVGAVMLVLYPAWIRLEGQ